jgi:hypothetical protein
MSMNSLRDRYESINKRDFRSAILYLLENEYKILGSHKILQMLAEDIIDLHKEFYLQKDDLGFGDILLLRDKGHQGTVLCFDDIMIPLMSNCFLLFWIFKIFV